MGDVVIDEGDMGRALVTPLPESPPPSEDSVDAVGEGVEVEEEVVSGEDAGSFHAVGGAAGGFESGDSRNGSDMEPDFLDISGDAEELTGGFGRGSGTLYAGPMGFGGADCDESDMGSSGRGLSAGLLREQQEAMESGRRSLDQLTHDLRVARRGYDEERQRAIN